MSRRLRVRPGRADRLREPRQRHARADARAHRGVARGTGAGAIARHGDQELRARVTRARGSGKGRRMSLQTAARLTRNWGDPSAISLDGYVGNGGYRGLRAALDMSSAELVQIVKDS